MKSRILNDSLIFNSYKLHVVKIKMKSINYKA